MLENSSKAPEAPKRYFGGTQSVPVQHSGVSTPTASKGRFVESGEVLGTIRDYEGRVVETVTAPIFGYALYGFAAPPVRAGESVVNVASPSSKTALDPVHSQTKRTFLQLCRAYFRRSDHACLMRAARRLM